MVPTLDTTRLGFLMDVFLDIDKSVLFQGVSGVGKSAIVMDLITQLRENKNYMSIVLNFSAQTTAIATQVHSCYNAQVLGITMFTHSNFLTHSHIVVIKLVIKLNCTSFKNLDFLDIRILWAEFFLCTFSIYKFHGRFVNIGDSFGC